MFYTVCHNIRSRENVGSVFRTADAFGVAKIFLTGFTPTPLHPATGGTHPKISKTALGAENFVPWEKVFSPSRLIKKLRADEFEIVALEQSQNSVALAQYRPKKNIALIIGNEVSGIPPRILQQCDKIIEIPMHGKKESLNVAIAFGVMAYAMTQKIAKVKIIKAKRTINKGIDKNSYPDKLFLYANHRISKKSAPPVKAETSTKPQTKRGVSRCPEKNKKASCGEEG